MNNQNMIKFENISVVVQGVIHPDITKLTLLSIRKFLPNSKIILSTWNGSEITGLEFDQLVLNQDPGGFNHTNLNKAKCNNVNRLILSSLNGIKAAKTKYVMKLRTDFLLTGNTFLNFFDRYNLTDPNFALFKHKVLACSYFSRNPKKINLAYHPSDIAFFGLKLDLLDLFDINLMPKSDEFYIFENGEWQRKYAPEQYIFISFLRKKGVNVSFSNQFPIAKKQIKLTEKYFTSNFIFLEWRFFNLKPPKKLKLYRELDHFSCITYIEWKKLYYKHVIQKPNKFVGFDFERIKLNLVLKYYKLLKIIAKFITFFIFGKNNKKLRKKIRKKITGN